MNPPADPGTDVELNLGETVMIAMLVLTGVVTLPFLLATFISGFACGYNGGPPRLHKPRGDDR